MGEVEFGELKGEPKDIAELAKNTNIDLEAYLKIPKKAKFGYKTLLVTGICYITSLLLLWYIPQYNPSLYFMFAMSSIAIAGLLAVLVWIYQRDKVVTTIVVVFSLAMLLVSLGVITPKDASEIIFKTIEKI